MKIARIYLDCDLRCSFEGLKKLIGKSADELGKGDLTLFLNRKATAFKLMAGKDYLTYYRNGGRRIPLEAIQHLPTFFDGQSLNFAKAIEKTIKGKLGVQ